MGVYAMQKLKNKLQKKMFLTSPLSAIINPLYILRRGLYKIILNIAPSIHGDILDFGCGSKPYESLFKNAKNYVGVDLAVSGHDHKDSKIDYFYDGKKLPFLDKHFDAVVCFEVLEHVFNLEEMLGEIKRVLKPEGKFLVSIPFAWGEHETPYDFGRYTSHGIEHLLKKNGFDILALKKTTTGFLAISQLIIGYLVEHVFPKKGLLKRFFQLSVIFPFNVFALLLNTVMPKSDDFFCNIVVLSKMR